MEISNCTRCKASLVDLQIDISFNIKTNRIKESGVWENIPNLNNDSREVLCKDCFDLFVKSMEQMNIKHQK